MLLTILALSCLSQATATVTSQAVEIIDLDELVESVHAGHDVPGLWVGVVDLEGLTAAGAHGVRERGKDESVTLDDRLHLGSCSKSMTASLAAVLAKQEVISFEDSITDFFPELEVDDGWKPVTLRHLLAHRGGAPFNLVEYAPLGVFITMHKGAPPTHRVTLAAGLLKRPPAQEPGTEFEYSNDGYALLTAALEARTKRAWREMIAAELFAPIGIERFGFGPPDALEDQPMGHDDKGAPAPLVDNPEAYGPAGRVHMTLDDWARYAAWHIRGLREGTELLPEERFTELHRPHFGGDADGNYACGWVQHERGWSKGKVSWHNGSNTVWLCAMWLAPAEGVAYLGATNQGGPAAEAAVDSVIFAAIEHSRSGK